MTYKNGLAENLKSLRLSRGVSQQELAKDTGISQQNISRWELGRHIPNIEECIKLADYFGITLDELVDRDI